MSRIKQWMLLALSLAVMLSVLSACGEDGGARRTYEYDEDEEEYRQEEPPEEETVYEKQTVYLCTGYTTTQHDSGSTRSYEFDYDEYGNFTEYKHILDGELQEHKVYRYDYEAGTGFEDRYSENGELIGSVQVKIGSVNYKIGGTAGQRSSQFVYNEEGYVIEEYDNGWKYVSTYNEDYTAVTEYAYKEGEETYLSREGTLDGKGNLLTEYFYRADGSKSVTKLYAYDEMGRILRIDTDIHSEYVPYSYPIIYTYDEHGNLIKYDVSYYYGYDTVYEYQAFEIWVPVTGE